MVHRSGNTVRAAVEHIPLARVVGSAREYHYSLQGGSYCYYTISQVLSQISIPV
jgi:hypothetical protein